MTVLPPASQLVTVFGGSGFLGRHVVRALARRGYRVRAAVRRPDLAGFLQPLGSVGQVTAVQANLRYPDSVAAAVKGADAVINYRETPDLDAELARLAPEGIHVYFENVGGAMLDAALNHMALHGRIVLCGLIEQYNGQGSGPRNLAQVIRKRILIQGLLVSDHWQHYGEFLAEAIPAFEAGALQAEETVSTGLASMPQAFIGLFEGRNTGKMLVKLD